MKFIVRSGFVVHDTKIVELDGQKAIQTKGYFGGESVDFDENTALQHAHRLEADDDEAKAFFAEKFPPIPTAAEATAPAGDNSGLSAAIAALAKQVGAIAESQSNLTNLVGQVTEVVQTAVTGAAPDSTQEATGTADTTKASGK